MADGQKLPLLVEMTALRQQLALLEASSPPSIGHVLHDVAEALWESAERFRATFEQAPIGIAHIAPDGHFLRVNRKLCDLVGYEPDELQGMSFQQITHPEDLRADEELIQRMLSGELETYNREKRCCHQSGSIVWVHLTVSLVRESSGHPKYFISIVDDITARKQAEALRQLNESRFNSLLALSEQAPNLAEQDIIVLGLEEAVRLTQSQIGYFHFVNEDQKTLQLFAWSRETLKTCTAAPTSHYPLDLAGVWADCARQRRPAIHNDYQSLPNKQDLPQGHSHLIRHMSVPVIEQNKVRMIIGVGNKPDDYDEADTRQLQLVANYVWKIIGRHRAEARIQRMNRFYATLSQINRALIRIQDRTQLFQELHRVASDSELFAAVWIGMLDAAGQMQVVAGDLDPMMGLRATEWPCPALALSECCVIGEALQRGAPAVCHNLQAESRPCRDAAQRADIHACVALPIREQDRVVGVFMAYAAEAGLFDETLVHLLQEMVDDISFGLDTRNRPQ
jgi:PAS domain S-box-containing protein